ncbi:spermidine/putrescine-binding periplasmic protein [Salmonella enterica subsp. arizonae]|uniref:Spermidine/putrescine-binding periplasmic protein n=1 Tax=Salmonella enterica subsp. arizonae TaxID=59203 RepID=A0A379TC48_SALER|nr:spermidine/putrescine-binding periplasmic protein [Salmonella enterica subsp. arizonae]
MIKSLYPDAQTISKGEWQNDVGDASAIYEEYYQKLKSRTLIQPKRLSGLQMSVT